MHGCWLLEQIFVLSFVLGYFSSVRIINISPGYTPCWYLHTNEGGLHKCVYTSSLPRMKFLFCLATQHFRLVTAARRG